MSLLPYTWKPPRTALWGLRRPPFKVPDGRWMNGDWRSNSVRTGIISEVYKLTLIDARLLASSSTRENQMRDLLPALLGLILCTVVGCQYYEEYRVKKTTADLKEEQAQLLRDYRLCLEKYQNEPPKAKEYCAPYTQRLRELEITRQQAK